MVRSSTYVDEKYEVYEAFYYSVELDATDEGNNYVDLGGIISDTRIPHAIVTAEPKYARAYIDGELVAVASIAVVTTYDTRATFANGILVSGKTLELYVPLTTGNLITNATSGKLDSPRMQSVQNWDVDSKMEQVPECGTERKEPVEFAPEGTVTLGLNRYGNSAMADFTKARAGKDDGDDVYLVLDVIDSTVSTATHDLLLEAKVESYGRSSRAVDSLGGIVTDTITFSFVPDVVTL